MQNFFVPETLTELKDFLLYIKKEHNNFFIIELVQIYSFLKMSIIIFL